MKKTICRALLCLLLAACLLPLTARTAGGRLVHCTGDRSALGEYRDIKITDSNTWALFGAIE